VRTRLALTVFCIALAPATLHAQDWRDAYATLDYQRAAALLLPIVFHGVAEEPSARDAVALEALADLYARGLGIPQDPILACTLLSHAASAARSPSSPARDYESAMRYLANIERLDKLWADRCSILGQADREESSRLLPCPTAPFPTHTLDIDLAGGHILEFDRRGLRIRRGLAEHSWTLNDLAFFGCPAAFELVRHARVDPPPGAARKTRHFLEIFSWTVMSYRGQPQLGLLWHVLEIGDRGWSPRGFETVALVPRRWPLPSAPPTLTTVEFRMQPDGAVRWRFAGSDGPTGTFDR